MSQRVFRTQTHEILTGWDGRLQYFFLVIERTNASPHDEDEGYEFSNLNLSNPAMSLDQLRDMLKIHDITPPDNLFADLENDRVTNCRERFVYQ